MSVGVAVALTSGAIILIGVVVLIILSVANAVQLRPDVTPIFDDFGRLVHIEQRPRVGWINADQFIWALSILAAVVLVLTPLVAWLVAQRAVKPMAEALRLQRHFVADASHELRTPLTALSSRVQILQRRLKSGKPIDDIAEQLRADTSHVTRVLDDMLLTAEGAPIAGSVSSSVSHSIHEAVSSLSSMADQAQIRLTARIDQEMMVGVPDTSLTRAIVAVIDNAIQHSPNQTTVSITASQIGKMATICVHDQGPGIVGVNPDRIFERFSHGSETGGRRRSFGLGLALTSEVAGRFGGDIRVAQTGPEGTTFELRFPLV
jgi:signal transduction histidine kinase